MTVRRSAFIGSYASATLYVAGLTALKRLIHPDRITGLFRNPSQGLVEATKVNYKESALIP